MKNQAIYQRDPLKAKLENNGVATMTDASTVDEQRTLRFELEHFVCEGEYERGLVRILESYVDNQGQPEQPAAWVSGFFGSGKSHLAKMLRFLWTDFTFEDGATARGLANLPPDVNDLLAEISTLGRRGAGLKAAAGTLGAGALGSVRLVLLRIVFKSVGLPGSYAPARFCMWLKKDGIYEKVRAAVEAEGRHFLNEVSNHMYVSPFIAKSLLAANPNFAVNEKEAKSALLAQFPLVKDVDKDQFVGAIRDALAPGREMPRTVIILDEIQQFIGEHTSRSYVVQEVVEACSKKFGDRLLFVGTGQTALSGTPALQRLQGRFTVNVELSDTDVETVTRRVVLAKRPDCVRAVREVMDSNAGEVDRHLAGTRIRPRSEDKAVLVDDYPLLPVRRRFWDHVLRAVDRAGTAAQLRTQLRMVYDAIRETAAEPIGTVVPADFLYEEQRNTMVQSGALLREVNQTILDLDDGTERGELKKRVCALVFLIRKLPRNPGADSGVRATKDIIADLLVKDLARDGERLRSQLQGVLDELVQDGTLTKLDKEYGLQTKESSEWQADYRARLKEMTENPKRTSTERTRLFTGELERRIAPAKRPHGKCKEPRELRLHFGAKRPQGTAREIPVWVRDGWDAEDKSVRADARAEGSDGHIIFVFVPKTRAERLKSLIASKHAARDTLDTKGRPSTQEGGEARHSMQTRLDDAQRRLGALVSDVIEGAKVYQGGGNERHEASLKARIDGAFLASVDRRFPEFRVADDPRWHRVVARARKGTDQPLGVLRYEGKTEAHPVCAAVLSFVGNGKKGKAVRTRFSESPYGWPQDAVDGALISLTGSGHLRATINGNPVKASQLTNCSKADFKRESATVSTRQRLTIRKLFGEVSVSVVPGEEGAAAHDFLQAMSQLARKAGGESPLPARPNTNHLLELRSRAGNEQLLGIVERSEELSQNIRDWRRAGDLAEQRLPAYQHMLALAKHAEKLEAAESLRPQIDAIVANRLLLDDANPVPSIAKELADALRSTLGAAERRYAGDFDRGLEQLESSESWQKIDQPARDRILNELGIARATKGPTGTEQELLASLDRISLGDWHTHAAAVPTLFGRALTRADRLVEPKTRRVRLDRTTLRTADEVEEWVAKTKEELLWQVQQGPVSLS